MTLTARRRHGLVRSPGLRTALAAVLLLLTALGLHRFAPSRQFELLPAVIAGRAQIVDGDSLFIGGRRVRLVGIDAPEGKQTCTRERQPWPCGEAARTALWRFVAGHSVRCRPEKRDIHGRALAVCQVAGTDVNAAMVENGMAIAFGRYEREEQAARAAKRGLWSGEFESPQAWRHVHGDAE